MSPSSSVRQSLSLFKSTSYPVLLPILTRIEQLKELNVQLGEREANLKQNAKYFEQHPDVLIEYLIATLALLKEKEYTLKSIPIDDSMEEGERAELACQESVLNGFSDRALSIEQAAVHAQDTRGRMLPPQKSSSFPMLTAALGSIPEERALQTYTRLTCHR